MTSDRAVLHALSAEPPRARSGETVTILFRTRNLGTSPSPSGTVVFELGDGLEALDDTDVAVEPVAAGEHVVARLRARILATADDAAGGIVVRAALHLGDTALPANPCVLRVFGYPLLDGPASGTSVELADDATVRVRAVVANEGDAAARDVEIVVPAPDGCVRLDDGGSATPDPLRRRIERLGPGERAEAAFIARIAGPGGELIAEGAVVSAAGGLRAALPARDAVALHPAIAAPLAEATCRRGRVTLRIGVRNDGWCDAREVRVGIVVPPSLVPVELSVDGMPVALRSRRRAGAAENIARIERRGAEIAVVLSSVDARSTVGVALFAVQPASAAGGTFSVAIGDDGTEVPFVPEAVQDVRVRLAGAPRSVTPGEHAVVDVRLSNAGDVTETLTASIDGDGRPADETPALHTLLPGEVRTIPLRVNVPEDVAAGTVLRVPAVVRDAAGERARAEIPLRVRAGATLAANPPAAGDAPRAGVSAVLHAPADVLAGAPFAVHLDVGVDDALAVLTIRVEDLPGCAYVPGSMRLDGRALLERGTNPPDELTLRDVPAGTRVALAWSVLAGVPHGGEALVVGAAVEADGDARLVPPALVRVREPEPFPLHPTGLPYGVESYAIVPQPDGQAAPVVAEPVIEPVLCDVLLATPCEFLLRLSSGRRDEIARFIRAPRSAGLIDHVLALRVFFPDAVLPADAELGDALDALRTALAGVFDRLFVKLRIPGFDVACDDLEDAELRSALMALVGSLATAEPERFVPLAACCGARYGAPVVLRALAALLPRRCDDEPSFAAALARYAEAIDEVLAAYEGVPLELFEDALAHRSDAALDALRTRLFDSLHVPLAELAC